jgi:hypothetical protein
MSCIMGGKVNKLTDDEIGILEASIKIAQVLDDSLDQQ